MGAVLWGAGGELDLFAGEVGGVDEGVSGEVADGGEVGREIVGLDEGAGVPVDAEPGEEVDGEIDDAGFDARGVEIFDAEEDVPGVLAGEGPGGEEGAGVAEVEGAGGGGGEAGAAWCGGGLGNAHDVGR